MSNPHNHSHGGAHGSFEHQDLSPRSVIHFFIWLSVFVVVIYLIVYGIYRGLDSYNHANQSTMSPMVSPEADTRAVTPAETQAFPEPRLEENERTELRSIIEDQDSKLATYQWIDKDKGIVQIPIDRAMDLIVQRGLPVRPQSKDQAGSVQTMDNGQPQKEGSSAQ